MSRLFAALKAQPDAAPAYLEQAEIDQRYRYWRWRILSASLVGYAIYYFVRTNISVALPEMQKDLGYTKAQLGIILTVGGVVYGISKFANGFLGDRSNPRYFMAIGLLLCAAMNVLFGLSSALVFLAAFWLMNNWAQGMGFPPCARNMGYWFSPKERGTTFGIWHTGHTAGAALVAVLTGYIIKLTGDWRLCFFVPAGIAVAGAGMLLLRLRDTPGSLGLPPVELWKGEETPRQLAAELHQAPPAEPAPGEPARVLDYQPPQEESYFQLVLRNIFLNPFMWIISVANLLVYTLRYATLHWGPTYLQEMKQISPLTSSWLHSGNEIAGLVSALLAGVAADRLFRGRAGRVCVIAMAAMAVAVYLFWITPPAWPWVLASLYLVMGFMVYVPQMLIAAMAMNLGTKRAAAAAVGLTGIFGYASSVVSGWGVGSIVDRSGWDGAFALMLGCAIATMALMALTWNVGAHPHLEKRPAPGGPTPQPVAPEAVAAQPVAPAK
jgi:OPA family glycerol-3-phosphate transporter-like MFS transporter/OPA family sugar phosphate sensor protein UhpC-like MFS transporter